MPDIVDVAVKEIGYKEKGENRTKYGEWYGMNGAKWCHMFVSWCANQAGMSPSVIPKTASTDQGMAWFKKKKRFGWKGSHAPKRGDIVYFKTGASHVGIVERTAAGRIYTIEGNSKNMVARRDYPLDHKTITGYGVPDYKVNSDTGSKKTVVEEGRELDYLNKILIRKPTAFKPSPIEVVNTKINPDLTCSLIIQNSKGKASVPVLDDMQLTYERFGMPGTLKFETMLDFKIEEGNRILLNVNGRDLFFGFVFTIEQTGEDSVTVTAYDQLRYFKNKDICIYTAKTANEVLRQIADKYKLTCGTLENTGYKMSRVECDITLFDIIQNALDETLIVKGEMYVLYDSAGKITLRNIRNMKVDSCVIDTGTIEGYTYKSSIDSDTYNQVKLIFEDEKNGSYNTYIEKDTDNISKWGLLQYTENISNEDVGRTKSRSLLKWYDRKRRNLTINNCYGNSSVRAGSFIPVLLDLSNVKIQNYMMVEQVTHKFSNREHKMDLTLLGGDFVE